MSSENDTERDGTARRQFTLPKPRWWVGRLAGAPFLICFSLDNGTRNISLFEFKIIEKKIHIFGPQRMQASKKNGTARRQVLTRTTPAHGGW